MKIIDLISVNKIPEKHRNLFNDFCKEVKETNPYIKPNMVKVNILDNPVINIQALRDKLMNIDRLNDTELYNLIMNTYDNILSDIFVNGDMNYLNIFTNNRFVTILTQVMYKINVSYDNRIYCNKIVYDYFMLNNGNQYTKDLLMGLARAVNRDMIPLLAGLGLNDELATMIVLSRFSSKKELVNIKRMNFAICSSDPEFMTEQRIIYIYEKLIDNFTFLFEGTMFDVLDYTASESYAEIFSYCSLAVLDILNNMPSYNIRKVLVSYAGDYHSLLNTNHSVRFSMQSLSMDYYRIIQEVEYLKNVEKIYIP